MRIQRGFRQIIRQWGRYLPVLLLVFVHCTLYKQSVTSAVKWTQETYTITLGDYVADFFMGVLPFSETQQDVFNIPPIWSFYLLYFFALIAWRSSQSFQKSEYQYLIRSKTRERWWRYQSAMLVMEAVWYVAVTIVAFLLFGICARVDISGFDGKFQMFRNGVPMERANDLSLFRETILMTGVILLSIGFLQYTISVKTNAVIGLLLSITLIVSSVFWMHPFLPGNYLMLIRAQERMAGGVNGMMGLGISCAVILVCFFFGRKMTQNKDLF